MRKTIANHHELTSFEDQVKALSLVSAWHNTRVVSLARFANTSSAGQKDAFTAQQNHNLKFTFEAKETLHYPLIARHVLLREGKTQRETPIRSRREEKMIPDIIDACLPIHSPRGDKQCFYIE